MSALQAERRSFATDWPARLARVYWDPSLVGVAFQPIVEPLPRNGRGLRGGHHLERPAGEVDDGGRPLELVLGATAGRLRVTTTGLDDAPALVAQRAMARPEEVRLDPLVVCDDGGRALGLVTVERLVGHLAQP